MTYGINQGKFSKLGGAYRQGGQSDSLGPGMMALHPSGRFLYLSRLQAGIDGDLVWVLAVDAKNASSNEAMDQKSQRTETGTEMALQ